MPTRSVPSNCSTEYPVGLKLCRTTLLCPRIIFGKVDQSYFLVKFDPTMFYNYYCQNYPINDFLSPLGLKISLFLRSEQPFPRYSCF